MASNKNFLYYLSAIAIFLLLKTVYPYAENDDLFFILSPVNRLLEFLTNSESQYYSDSGYYYQTLNILIEKSCSGFNFLMLCFLMLAFQLAGYFNKNNFKYLLLPFALFLSYILTIFTNTSRIILSILGQNTADKFLPSRPHYLIHSIIGTLVYLSFLILYFLAIRFILDKRSLFYEKPV